MELTVTTDYLIETIEGLCYWCLYYYPNNRRKFKGKPLVRNRAFAKAYKNERRK